MIIGVCGCGYTGSGIIIDFLSDYDSVQVLGGVPEFSFSYIPGGIEYLDFAVNQSCNRFYDSLYAVDNYLKTISNFCSYNKKSKYVFERLLKSRFKQISDNYIDSISDFSWDYIADVDFLFSNSTSERVLKKISYKLILLFEKLGIDTHHFFNLLATKRFFCFRPDNFIESTQEYICNILEEAGLDLGEPIILNQPFPGNNPLKSMTYFRDSKAIIVKRDPRDIYLSAKKYYPRSQTAFIPIDTVDKFICYYNKCMKVFPEVYDNDNVLVVNMEDCILNHSVTMKKILDFVNLNTETVNIQSFNPNISIGNIALFKKSTDYGEDIKKIEKELESELFCFKNYNVESNIAPFTK